MKDPVINKDGPVFVANATTPLRTIIGIAAVGTIFAFLAVNPVLEFITALVFKSGY
jgi:NADH-quinone oxidoreductase subunit N